MAPLAAPPSRIGFPLGARLTLAELEAHPYPALKRLREHEPVSWVPALGMWMVTRYRDVDAVLRDPQTYTTDSSRSTIRDTFGRQMLSVDGPDQKRYKTESQPTFNARSIRDLWAEPVERWCRERVNELVNRHRCELMKEVARPLSLATMGLVLGLPSEDLPRVHGAYQRFEQALANFDGDPQIRRQAQEAAAELRTYLEQRLAAAREGPPDPPPHDPSASLIGRFARLAPDRLSPSEAVANLLIILFGGIETTEAMIGNAVWSLLEHPEALDRVRRDPKLADATIEESLRWEPAVQSCTRHTTREVELAGVTLPPDATVQCMIGGANRDPEIFPEPDRFDIDRPNRTRHLSFGLGSHFCLGAQLARLETRTVLTAILESWPSLGLDSERPSAPRGHEFRKPPELWLRWDQGQVGIAGSTAASRAR